MACTQLPKYLPGRETRTPDDFELFLEGILEAPPSQRRIDPPVHSRLYEWSQQHGLPLWGRLRLRRSLWCQGLCNEWLVRSVLAEWRRYGPNGESSESGCSDRG